MSLNIKNDAVHAAVRELAHRLGVSQTSAVEIAVRRALEATSAASGDRAALLRSAAAGAAEAFRGVELRALEADLFDDATGLPR